MSNRSETSLLDQINVQMGVLPHGPLVYEDPTIFDLSHTEDQVKMDELLKAREVTIVFDPIRALAEALYEYQNPPEKNDAEKKEEYVRSVLSQGLEAGTFVYYGSTKELIRFAKKDEHFALRTYRNRNLITKSEQRSLYEKTILYEGLSVGSEGVRGCADSGIGNHYILAENDTVDPTNLNRRSGSGKSLGAKKIDETALVVSALDPWIKLTLLRGGISDAARKELEGTHIDLIVEAIDDLPEKARSRLEAKRRGIPHLMPGDFGNKAIVEVERYDLQEKTRFLHKPKHIAFTGRLSPKEISDLASSTHETDAEAVAAGRLTRGQKDRLMLKHVRWPTLSARMMQSIMQIEVELGGYPQLGRTAKRAGTGIDYAASKIFLGQRLPSGRYTDNVAEVFRSAPEVSAAKYLSTLLELLKYAKNRP